MAYNFNFRAAEGDWEVSVDTSAYYGFFEYVGESADRHVEGGLWFERLGKRLVLTDYDGVFDLPYRIRKMLTDGGFDLSRV